MRAAIVATTLIVLSTPLFVAAFPFGGQASQVIPCYNQAIWANLGPPRGGQYIWTPATRTYQFGPPSHAGQWLLGLASAPYYCIVSIEPIIVFPGIHIDMMGSSGSSAPFLQQLLNTPPSISSSGAPPPLLSSPTGVVPGSGANTTIPGGSGLPVSIGHAVISEVYSNVDAAHGTRPQDQWIEIYNGSVATADLSGWLLVGASGQSTLPANTTLAPGQFMMVFAASSTISKWPIPSNAVVISLGTLIAGGLSSASDVVMLKTPDGATIDAVSWGTNKSGLNPAASAAPVGTSLSRTNLSSDTNGANDWAALAIPKPGQ